ncbi:hypothetical protein N665_0109s0042 [Sinapis alba]|nr:hypothetical protein N665_0109s0042 [Sinapis alba]
MLIPLLLRTYGPTSLLLWLSPVSSPHYTPPLSCSIPATSRTMLLRWFTCSASPETMATFLSVCSHYEVPLELTLGYFEMMIYEYGIKPSVEHCCSLIRAMAQRGEIWQAKMVIQEFGFGSAGVAWRALLGACSAGKDLKAAKAVAVKMVVLGEVGEDEYVYIVMSNLYAYHERWREVSRIRKIMREKGLEKEVGSRWIQEQNVAIQL